MPATVADTGYRGSIAAPAPDREPRLAEMLGRIKDDDVSYRRFADAAEPQNLVEDDLAVLLSERFELTRPPDGCVAAPLAGALAAPATPLVDRELETAAVSDLVLAAAGALLQAKGSGWLHAYAPRAPHDNSVLAALRSGTGDAADERAWAWGRSLAGAQAVSYALEEAGRPSGL